MRTSIPTGRALHVLDVEYLGCGCDIAGCDIARVVERYRVVAECGEHDLLLGAASHHFWERFAFDLPSDLRFLLAGGGPDAADNRLLDELQVLDVLGRFERIVFASGDHAFAPVAAALNAGGIETWAVGYPWNMARTLRDAVHTVAVLGVEFGLAA